MNPPVSFLTNLRQDRLQRSKMFATIIDTYPSTMMSYLIFLEILFIGVA